jgi:hypothetical protein
VLRRAFPNRQLVPVRINQLAHGGGGIHCITQQQPAGRCRGKRLERPRQASARPHDGIREERFMNKVVATMQFACQGERVSGRVSG